MRLQRYVSLVCIVLLSSCGFHLRGAYQFPFKHLYVASASPRIQGKIRLMVEGGSNALVVEDPKQADAILTITEQQNQGILTLSQYGSVEEYAINYSMNYSLQTNQGVVLIMPSQINLNRAMTYSDQYALAKAEESQLLYKDMQDQAIDQLLRRLSSAKTYTEKGQALPGIGTAVPMPPPPL